MKSDFSQESFDAWLEYNSSPGPGEDPQAQVQFLAAAMPGTPVVTNNLLTGPSAARALQLDDAYSSAAPSERVSKLQESPLTGCAMLMTLARQKSGYNPTTPAVAGSVQNFLNYVRQILKCPLFSTVLNDHISPGFSGNWGNIINQIAGYYKGIDPGDLKELRRSLTAIAAAASSNPSTNETLNMFSQATLNAGREVDVYMYYTYVQMKTTVHHGGKNEPDRVSNQTSLSLYRVQLRFNSSQWPAKAAQVHQQTDQSLREWLNDSSPQGSLATGWAPK